MSWARNSDNFALGLPPLPAAQGQRSCWKGRSSSLAAAAKRELMTPRRIIAEGFLEAAEGLSSRASSKQHSRQTSEALRQTSEASGAGWTRAQDKEIAAICVQIGREAALKSRGSRDAFRFVDADRGGSITRVEVRCFFSAYNVSEQDADKFFNCLDKKYTGQVDYREFLKLVGPFVQAEDGQARTGSKESCSTMDSDSDVGAMTLPGTLQEDVTPPAGRSRTWPIASQEERRDADPELQHMVRIIGDKVALKYSTFRNCFRALDTDKDGQVSPQDLQSFFVQCSLPVKSADSFFAAMDKDGSGFVDYIEFMAMFGPVIQPGYQERSVQDLRSAHRPSMWRVC